MIHSKHSSSSFCILPFVQQFVDTDNHMLPCCIGDRNDIGPEYKDVTSFNNKYLKTIRKEMLHNQKPKACSACWTTEASGKNSKRIKVNKQFEDWTYEVDDNGTVVTMPQYYDLRPGNVCNLKCVMCNPRVSSKWIEDNHLAIEPYEKTVKFSNKQIDEILSNASMIKRLQLAGGEPFYMPSVKRLLQGLVDSGNSKHIDLQITTNLTILDNNILQLLEHFKKNVITISVDGLEGVGEYIRYPLNWDTFETNLNTLLQQKHIRIAVNITKSKLNAEHIDAILDWCFKKGLTDVDINTLTEPSILAVGSPQDKLIDWLTALDKHRGTNSKLTLPWIYKMRTKEEILTEINKIMDEQIQPNVAQHGGEVKVLDFDMETGTLKTLLSGSCSGCSSSMITLKMGIENMLKHYIPEVTQVVGEDDPNFNDPYHTMPMDDYDPMDRM